ncbi:MAG: porin [Herbaspirillum sp.]|nr:porin [Herbaspirillum sp.]
MKLKKSLLALSVLGTVSGAVSAQTNITLYGIADAGMDYDTGKYVGGSVWAVRSGQQNSSRFGIKGSEDLGGGLSTSFVLENGFQLNDGSLKYGASATTPRLFGRQAWISLDGGFGSVKVGRQYSSMYFALGAFDPFGISTAANAQNLFGYGVDALDPISRSDNTVSYTTPTIGGLSGLAGYKFGATPGSANTSTKFLGVTYANGPLLAMASYQNADGVNFSGFGAPSALGAIVAQTSLGAVANTTTGTKVDTGVAGASYDFGVAKLALAYGATKASAVGDVRMNNYLVGVTVRAGTGSVLSSWNRSHVKDISGGVTNMYSLGYKYPMSKMTDLYAYSAYTRNGSGVRLNALVNGASDFEYQFGIQHRF